MRPLDCDGPGVIAHISPKCLFLLLFKTVYILTASLCNYYPFSWFRAEKSPCGPGFPCQHEKAKSMPCPPSSLSLHGESRSGAAGSRWAGGRQSCRAVSLAGRKGVWLGSLRGALPPLQPTSSSTAGQVLSLMAADATSKQATLRVTVQ